MVRLLILLTEHQEQMQQQKGMTVTLLTHNSCNFLTLAGDMYHAPCCNRAFYLTHPTTCLLQFTFHPAILLQPALSTHLPPHMQRLWQSYMHVSSQSLVDTFMEFRTACLHENWLTAFHFAL